MVGSMHHSQRKHYVPSTSGAICRLQIALGGSDHENSRDQNENCRGMSRKLRERAQFSPRVFPKLM